MKRELQLFAKNYLKEIEEDNAAIFAGAGLSTGPKGYVNWKGLLKDIANELGLEVDKETDLIALAQYYENHKGGRGGINAKLVQEFTKNAELSENHQILASLPIKTYWTTNYDTLIEDSLRAHGKKVDCKICVQNLATNVARIDAVVYKMHGDISLPHEAIITKDDYQRYNESRQLFTTALQGDLVSKTFLFIGFSFEDPNLEYILSRIRILLGNNTRDHYCFLRSVNEVDFATKEEYIYEKTKQELRVKDLKRYSIQALMVDSFDEITNVLRLINHKLRRRNIFISGAAHDYGSFEKERAERIVYNLSQKLSKKEYKIISGFGLGIGSSVINGVLSHVYSDTKLHLDDYLLLRPFPQNIKDDFERIKLWSKYRYDMLKEAGIAIFFFGNKKVDDQIVHSEGVIEEFNIANDLGTKVIPVGLTEFVARDLWQKVMKESYKYYGDNHEVETAIANLGDVSLNDEDIVNNIIKTINLLQNET